MLDTGTYPRASNTVKPAAVGPNGIDGTSCESAENTERPVERSVSVRTRRGCGS